MTEMAEQHKITWQGTVGYSAVLLVAMMGAAVTTLMPLIVGAFSDTGLYSDQQVGFLAAADVAGILVASASAFFWVRHCPWRGTTLVSLLLFILANGLTAYVTDTAVLLLVRFLAGVACGVGYAIALAALGDRPLPDKAFGVMVTLQVIFGTLGFALLPQVIADYGVSGIFLFFNLSLLLALLLAMVQFPANQKNDLPALLRVSGSNSAAWLVFAGVVAYYFAQGTVWAYLERIGQDAGLSMADISWILGVGFAVSAAGSALSGWYVKHRGRLSAIWLTWLVQIPCLAALYWMGGEHLWWIYALTTVIYQIFWSFVVPVMMGIFNDADRSGRLIVFCVTAFKVGLVLGPPVAGFILTWLGVRDVLWAGALAISLSCLCLHLAQKRVAPRLSKQEGNR